MRTLVITNDFPPRTGGIQTFVHSLAVRLPPEEVVVLASTWRGAERYDATQAFPVVRQPTRVLLPTPAVLRRARDIARAEGCSAVWFGAAAPLGLLAPGLRRAGVERFVASTHGHEAGWAVLPGARNALRRIGRGVDAMTYLGEYTRQRIAAALGPTAAGKLVRLPPGVDTEAFSPAVDGSAVRRAHGLGGRPTVVCVSRLVPRKGQDVLLRAMPAIRRAVPDAALLLVGGGPDRSRLDRLTAELGLIGSVVTTGSVPAAALPAHYAAGDVFAMPCRTRRGGLDVEGLGMVYLEASATGLPVVAGRSGGAPDAVLDGVTGRVVDGRDVNEVARVVSGLLTDAEGSATLGRAGRDWVEREWRWSLLADRLRALISGHPLP